MEGVLLMVMALAAAALGIGTSCNGAAAAAHFLIRGRGGRKTATKHAPLCFLSWDSRKAPTPPTIISGSNKATARARARASQVVMASSSSATETEKLGIKIVKNPPESELSEIGVRSWPKWGCPPSNFPWTYSAKETCYLLKGKVKVYPDGSKEAVEIGAGDLVIFPKGMSCTWDVSEAVDKHYQFD